MTSANNNILVIDDTPENLTVLRRILTDRGYRVRPALSGELALNSIKKDRPDLILLDVMMPGMDGFEVCRRLKSEIGTRGIPILFISALNETEDKVKAFQSGGVDYIAKPFHVDEVLARVETHLKLCQMHKEIEGQNLQLQNEVEERKKAEKALEKVNLKLERLALLGLS